MATIRITNGTVVDPANNAQAYMGDVWFEDDRIIRPPSSAIADQTIDATGSVVMPGGIDLHSHFVGPKVNTARQMLARAEFSEPTLRQLAETRAKACLGPAQVVPSIIDTGLRYLGLGYTTAFDAAVPPAFGRQAIMEIQDLPGVDAGFYSLVGNHQYMLQAVSDSDTQRVEQFLSYVINQSGAYAPKIVNPGGVEQWKSGERDRALDIDETLAGFDISPRQIIQHLSQAANNLGLPHPIHIHSNRLGLPGNWRTTLATMEALGDLRGHLAHIQFHSYLGADDEVNFASAVGPLSDYVNNHKNISIDIGQVMFGSTMSMTADSQLGYYLQRITGAPWVSYDTEVQCGCGISPIRYKNKNRVHALQWAIGLEWLLMVNDPWQMALSTDHPNGGSFLTYPQIIALLMDADLRQKTIGTVHRDVIRHSALHEINREYSLEEIAIITRAAPAKILGLTNKGHLGPGADADITVYETQTDRCKMFQFPRYVIKSGKTVVDGGELSQDVPMNQRISSRIESVDERDVARWSRKNTTLVN